MAGEQVRILVVDDEEPVRNLLQRVLKEVGYDYITKPFNRDDVVLKVQKTIEKRDLLWHLLKNVETPD